MLCVFDMGFVQCEFVEVLCWYFVLLLNCIVLEVVEQLVCDEVVFVCMIDMIQYCDFLIVIDDFGIGFLNFDCVWCVWFDIVKFDCLLVECLIGLVDDCCIMYYFVLMLYQVGVMVLVEGVESDDVLQVLMEVDIDFVQGFQFGQFDVLIVYVSVVVFVMFDVVW